MTEEVKQEAEPEQPLYLPSGTLAVGHDGIKPNVLMVVAGTSGVGKSHLGYQLIRDKDFGPEAVLFLMAEDATATYDPPAGVTLHVKETPTIDHLNAVVDELIRAHQAGRRLPRIIFYDSLSGGTDYQMIEYESNPINNAAGKRDKFAEYGDMGLRGMTALVKLRDAVPCDVIVLVTTFETAYGPPELAVAGKMLPKNLTRLTNITLYMKAETVKFDPQAPPNLVEAAHRTIARDEQGRLTGEVINRFFLTLNSGEIQAKGSHKLAYRERAILPDVLRKLHRIDAAVDVK